jgi:hypothetical protein
MTQTNLLDRQRSTFTPVARRPRHLLGKSLVAVALAASLPVAASGQDWNVAQMLAMRGSPAGLAPLPMAAEEISPPRRFEVEALHDLATCIVERDRDEAERILTADFGGEDYADAIRRLSPIRPLCLGPHGGLLRMSGIVFAGGLAEALLRKDLAEAQLAASLRAPEQALQARNDVEYIALCMVLAQPAQTSALLYTDATAREADAKLVEYANALPGCVRPDQQFRINKLGLRALAALAAYRISVRNRTG